MAALSGPLGPLVSDIVAPHTITDALRELAEALPWPGHERRVSGVLDHVPFLCVPEETNYRGSSAPSFELRGLPLLNVACPPSHASQASYLGLLSGIAVYPSLIGFRQSTNFLHRQSTKFWF